MNNGAKKIYVSPQVQVKTVELEQSVAAASVAPDAQQEWEKDDDDNRTIDW